MMRAALGSLLLVSLLGCARSTAPQEQSADTIAAHPELEFFNSLSATLEIELTAPPEKIENTANLRAAPGAKISSVKLNAEVATGEPPAFRSLSPEELKSVAFRAARIQLRGAGGIPVEHQATNGVQFTVQDMLDAVEETERQTREKSEWFGGMDIHHIYFEGIHPASDGVWDIEWGS